MRQAISVATKILDYLNDSMEMGSKIAVEHKRVIRETASDGMACLRTEAELYYIHSINVGELWDEEFSNIVVNTVTDPSIGISAIEFVYLLIEALRNAKDKHPLIFFQIEKEALAPYGVTWGLWNEEKSINESIVIEVTG